MQETQQISVQKQKIPEKKVSAKKKSSRFSTLLKFLLVLMIMWWFNNCTIKITKENITSEKVKNNIKIAVISDYHASEEPFSLKNESVIKKINKIKPDIVCILGDMHSQNASDSEKKKSLYLMTDIVREGYKVYFVLGEHDDRTKSYIAEMEEKGINVLNNEKQKIKIKNTALNLYGISNAYFSPSFDLRNEFDIDKKEYNILLAHIPMYKDYEKFGADLTICGDTHGGIIQIPFIGPGYCNDQFFPGLSSDNKEIYDKGLFDYKGGHLFITSGLGNYINGTTLPVRFFNRPEVAAIEISPK